MRPKSVKKFKDKIRELTRRKHNLDAARIEELNRVIRGTAQYFATRFFTGREVFHKLDSWMRLSIKCMKTKRKNTNENKKICNKAFDRLRLQTLESFCVQRR